MSAVNASTIIETCGGLWREQRTLCDALEQIADSLPDAIDRKVCLHVARLLPTLIARAHRYEEEVLFAALDRPGLTPFDPHPTLERLKIEHAGDECFAEELSEVLLSYAEGRPTHSAEATGYMLRGFFEALRRHIAIEEELSTALNDARVPEHAIN
ncbi:MAG: hemerythrin domain-containing protein [Alphaproteobacteria bacterium]|nr:hemerythrin domain-containing protein [Alphaproteobacteria bacterium]